MREKGSAIQPKTLFLYLSTTAWVRNILTVERASIKLKTLSGGNVCVPVDVEGGTVYPMIGWLRR